ncbi:hypothetical protein ACFY0F_10040 [Streptomyces sp. NPDC001544]|uniref:hypothetical protein n=1 Tax=Streptomyces sp. NPDC001544 TaxID=3364584 RepID=UPI00367DC27D
MTDQPYEGQNPYQRQGYDGHQGQQAYEGHEPYQQQAPQPQPQQPPQAWPGQAGYDQSGYDQSGYDRSGYGRTGHGPSGYGPSGYDQAGFGQAAGYDEQHTQQWQGQTWETQVHAPVQPPVAAAETAYLPQQGYEPAAPTHPQPPAAPQPPTPQPAASQPPAAQSPSASPSGPGYGPATLSGNARITDAQRARLEGRSPIIEPGMQPAALTALLGLLLSGAAAVGTYALVVPLVLLQAVTAAGWFRLNGMWPARQGIALAFAGALTADVAVLVAGRENAPAAILGPLGIWVLLTLVLQLRSHASPDERMYGLMATVVSTALAVIATGYLGADPDAVTVGAAAVAVALLARALPLPTPASVAVAVLAAAGAGIALGGVTDLGTKGAVLGAAAAVCALVGHRVAAYDYPSRFVHFTAGVALPLSTAAPVVWVLGRALG